MKNLIFLSIFLGFFNQSQAQSVSKIAAEIPAAVIASNKNGHPKATQIEWSKKGTNFESKFTENGNIKIITYDEFGNSLEEEEIISVGALPADVMKFVKSHYKNPNIDEASRIKNQKGIITYEVEIKGMNLIFDANGVFLKSEKE
jgi:hypothetical protein